MTKAPIIPSAHISMPKLPELPPHVQSELAQALMQHFLTTMANKPQEVNRNPIYDLRPAKPSKSK